MKSNKLFAFVLILPLVFGAINLALFMVDVRAGESNASVSAGSHHTLALKKDGTLWAWGFNYYGQLGIGTNEWEDFRSAPVQVGAERDWAAVSAGGGHTLALKKDGSLWAWGLNDDGQLGDNTTTRHNAPVRVGTDTDWAAISAGGYHSLALKSDGSLWAWGLNSVGQLGIGTSGVKNFLKTPVRVGTEKNWLDISAGDSHSLALKNESGIAGSLWAWGDNFYGQLGDGTNKNSNVPLKVGTATNWASVSAGGWHSLALKSNGSLWSWGWNFYGQLGDGTNTNRNAPVAITGSNWETVSAGDRHSLALKSDGSLWAWGGNDVGQLGDGTTTNRQTPVSVGSGWEAASAGGYHTLALKPNGSLWIWGDNKYGQLGNGTNGAGKFGKAPVQLGSDTDWEGMPGGGNLSVIFVAVTNIDGVPATATAGTPLALTGTVVPYNATNQKIDWIVKDTGTTGAYISGNILYTTAAGTAAVRATITNGSAVGVDYAQDFDITVNPAASNPVTGPPGLAGIVRLCFEPYGEDCIDIAPEKLAGDGTGNFFLTLEENANTLTIYGVEYIINNVPIGTNPTIEAEKDGNILPFSDIAEKTGTPGRYFSDAGMPFNHGDRITYKLHVGSELAGTFTVVYVNRSEYVEINSQQRRLAGGYYSEPKYLEGYNGSENTYEIISRPPTLGGTAPWINNSGQFVFARQTMPENMSREGEYIVRATNSSGIVVAVYIIIVTMP